MLLECHGDQDMESFRLHFFDDLMDKALPSSKHHHHNKTIMEWNTIDAFQRTAGELAAAQVELEELASCSSKQIPPGRILCH